MVIQINTKLTPYNFTSAENRKIEYIVIHYVGSVSTAKNNADYFASAKRTASAHYFVDEDGIWQSVDDRNVAWHCGGRVQSSGGHTYYGICKNLNSIGIEMCVKKTQSGEWYFDELTVDNTVNLARHLMRMYGIPVKNVIRHYDVTGKLCPYPYIDEAKWAEFKERLVIHALFSDIEGHCAQKEIEELSNMGIVLGDGTGNFRPDRGLTRAEACVIVRRTLKYLTGK